MPYTQGKTEPQQSPHEQESQRLPFVRPQNRNRVSHGKFAFTARQTHCSGGASKEFIVDSGSAVSLIKPGIYRSKVRSYSTTSFGVTGDTLDITGEQDVQFCLENWNYWHTFCVCSLPTEADGILGMDFLSDTSASLDIGRQMLKLQKRRGKRTPKPRRGNGEMEKNFVFQVEGKACTTARHGNASSCGAQVATVEGQYGDKKAKLQKRRSRKRPTNQWKTDREAPVHVPQDKKEKTRHFGVNDLVYLYWPVTKTGLTKKLGNPGLDHTR
jgi:hypothetical protein